MYWNYRICTYTKNEYTYIGITEVYYDTNNTIISYIDPDDISILSEWDDLNDLKGTYEYLKRAFDKPTVNLDALKLEEKHAFE